MFTCSLRILVNSPASVKVLNPMGKIVTLGKSPLKIEGYEEIDSNGNECVVEFVESMPEWLAVRNGFMEAKKAVNSTITVTDEEADAKIEKAIEFYRPLGIKMQMRGKWLWLCASTDNQEAYLKLTVNQFVGGKSLDPKQNEFKWYITGGRVSKRKFVPGLAKGADASCYHGVTDID